nr:MAG TPA: hypothetical protein [Caudoviricetes sp.]
MDLIVYRRLVKKSSKLKLLLLSSREVGMKRLLRDLKPRKQTSML